MVKVTVISYVDPVVPSGGVRDRFVVWDTAYATYR